MIRVIDADNCQAMGRRSGEDAGLVRPSGVSRGWMSRGYPVRLSRARRSRGCPGGLEQGLSRECPIFTHVC